MHFLKPSDPPFASYITELIVLQKRRVVSGVRGDGGWGMRIVMSCVHALISMALRICTVHQYGVHGTGTDRYVGGIINASLPLAGEQEEERAGGQDRGWDGTIRRMICMKQFNNPIYRSLWSRGEREREESFGGRDKGIREWGLIFGNFLGG